MIFAIALLMTAAQARPAAPPDVATMRAAAARCGLPADWMLYGHDEDGDYADASNAQRAVRIAPEPILCIMRWAGEAHARLGFISEPPPGPQTLAILPTATIMDAAETADRCGLLIKIDPLDAGRVTLLARRHAPAAQLACMRAWLSAHRLGPPAGR